MKGRKGLEQKMSTLRGRDGVKEDGGKGQRGKNMEGINERKGKKIEKEKEKLR